MQQELKQQLIETLVEYKVTPYKQATNGKLVDTKIVILEPRLDCYVKKMHKKTRNVNFNDFYSDCIFKIIEVVMDKFKPQYGWQVLINRTNTKAYNQLIRFLKNYIKKQALEGYIKERGYSTTENVQLENGEVKKRNVYVTTNFSSIDVTVNPESEQETTIGETVEHGFWDAVNDDSMANDFLDWYRANRNRILTTSQCEFLDTLEAHGYCKEDKRTEEMKEDGINLKSTSTKLHAIEKRILKAWQKERSYVETSFIERTLTRKISLLQIYLDLYDDGNSSTQKQLSDFVKANIDSSVMEEFLDMLSVTEYQNVALAVQNKTSVDCAILNKLYDFAEMKIARLEEEIVKEQQIKKQLAEEKGVVLSEEDKKPIYASSLYLHLDSYGVLYNRTKHDKLGA